MVRVIKELRPTWIVGENVAGIVRMALPDILSELETCGYWTRTFLIPACAVGARHRRYRVAIVGYSDCTRLQTKRPEQQTTGLAGTGEVVADTESQSEGRLSIGTEQEKSGFGLCGEHVANTNDWSWDARRNWEFSTAKEVEGTGRNIGGRAQEYGSGEWRTAESVLGGMADGFPARMDGDLDFLINHYWDDEPDIPRITTGIEHRADRLKCLGNAVVPQQFYPIFKAIAEAENLYHGTK